MGSSSSTTRSASEVFLLMPSRLNPRQSKVLERLLEAGHVGSGGGFLGGLSTDKHANITGTSKATAARAMS